MRIKNLQDKLDAMKPKNVRKCGCDEDHWCSDCVNLPTPQAYTLPDGTVTHGYFLTNQSGPGITKTFPTQEVDG